MRFVWSPFLSIVKMEIDEQLEQQININFLVKLGKNGPEIHQMLQQVYREDALKKELFSSGSSVFGKAVKTPRTMQGQDAPPPQVVMKTSIVCVLSCSVTAD